MPQLPQIRTLIIVLGWTSNIDAKREQRSGDHLQSVLVGFNFLFSSAAGLALKKRRARRHP
jgi:hypothetical protein